MNRKQHETVGFFFEGQAVEAQRGQSIATALVAAGHTHWNGTARRHAPRGPYCLMGGCFDCMVAIDDGPAQQACLVEVRQGMRVQAWQGHARRLDIADEGAA